MLANQGQAASVVNVIVSVSAANTAAATSSYIDVRPYEGDLVFIINVGAITGTCTPDFQDATDSGGTGSASIAANEGAYSALVANTARKYTINANAVRGFIRFVGTIATGPSLLSVQMLAHPKYA